MKMTLEHWWNDTDRREPRYCLSAALSAINPIGTGPGICSQRINQVNDQTKAQFKVPRSVRQFCARLELLGSATGNWILLKLPDLPVLAGSLDIVAVRISATNGIWCFWSGEEFMLYRWQGFEPRVVWSLWLRTCATLAHLHQSRVGWGRRPCPVL